METTSPNWPEERARLKRIKAEQLKERKQRFEETPKQFHTLQVKQTPQTKRERDISEIEWEIKEQVTQALPVKKGQNVIKVISHLDINCPFLVTSFFTVDSGYEKEVNNLIESLRRFGISYYIEGIRSFGNWVYNTQYKPILIKKALILANKPVVCIDADAVVQQYPELFEKLDCDFAAYFTPSIMTQHTKNPERIITTDDISAAKQLLSGTIFFNYTAGAVTLLDLWKEQCLRDRGEIDQDTLRKCAQLLKDSIVIKCLPMEYCQIYDLIRNKKKAVVEHFQASRRHRTGSNRSAKNKEKHFAILTPTRKRAQWLERMILSACETAYAQDRVKFFLLMPKEDTEPREMVNRLITEKHIKISIIDEPERDEAKDPVANLSHYWNLLYAKAVEEKYDYFGFFGDDVIFKTFCWDSIVAEEFEKRFRMPWFIRVNESGDNPRRNATLFFTNKLLHDIIGYYLPEHYKQTYMDTWMDNATKEVGCFTFLKNVLTYHASIVLGRAPKDQAYMDKLSNRQEVITYEHKLFHTKEEENKRSEIVQKLREYINRFNGDVNNG